MAGNVDTLYRQVRAMAAAFEFKPEAAHQRKRIVENTRRQSHTFARGFEPSGGGKAC